MAVTEESKLGQTETKVSETKFTEEELKSLSDLQQGYTNTQTKFGQIRVQRLLLNQQLEGLDEAELRLETEYTELQKAEREQVESLNKKYGAGNLDPKTGVFTPTS
jgi:hypothetical protein|tara:strand:- start:677 stop:994 length:318 start_codon:yes stop_codon:yes gene_type:complete